MDISKTEAVRDELMKVDSKFRDLVHQHQSYEDRLNELSSLTYPNEDEQLEEIKIKKLKLNLKDQMYAKIDEYANANANSH
jgi:uncharacterized protein YdcH (DUF465 family)